MLGFDKNVLAGIMADAARIFPKNQQPKYTGEMLREIRKRNGVGRPPAVIAARRAAGKLI